MSPISYIKLSAVDKVLAAAAPKH